ncbi:hypothetical protein HDU96_009263 [Phlyctochytrium bullatum]|nr:hypothetical protein HDU96_009263 [Phlyctochytrium bullatum]
MARRNLGKLPALQALVKPESGLEQVLVYQFLSVSFSKCLAMWIGMPVDRLRNCARKRRVRVPMGRYTSAIKEVTSCSVAGFLMSDEWMRAMNEDLHRIESEQSAIDLRQNSVQSEIFTNLADVFDLGGDDKVKLDEWNMAEPMSPTASMYTYRQNENESMVIDITEIEDARAISLLPLTPIGETMPRSLSALGTSAAILATSTASLSASNLMLGGSMVDLNSSSNGPGSLMKALSSTALDKPKTAPHRSSRQIEREEINAIQKEEEGRPITPNHASTARLLTTASTDNQPTSLKDMSSMLSLSQAKVLSVSTVAIPSPDAIKPLDPKTVKLLADKDEDSEEAMGYGPIAQQLEPIRTSLVEDPIIRRKIIFKRSFRHNITISRDVTTLDIEEYLSNYILLPKQRSRPTTPVSSFLQRIEDAELERLRREAEEKKAKVSQLTIALLTEGVPSFEAEKLDPTFKNPILIPPYKGSERARRAGSLRQEDLPRAVQVLEKMEEALGITDRRLKSTARGSRISTPRANVDLAKNTDSSRLDPDSSRDVATKINLPTTEISANAIQATMQAGMLSTQSAVTSNTENVSRQNSVATDSVPTMRQREPSNVEAVLLKMAKLSERADAVSNTFAKQFEESQKKIERIKEEKARQRRISQLHSVAGSSSSIGSLQQFPEPAAGGSMLQLEPLREESEAKVKNLLGDLLAHVSVAQEEEADAQKATPKKSSRGRLGQTMQALLE